MKVGEDGDCQDSQGGGAKDAAIASVVVDGRRHPAEKGGDRDQGCGHRQRETVVVDMDIEDDLSQKDEGEREDGQAHDQRSSFLRILSSINEINKGSETDYD